MLNYFIFSKDFWDCIFSICMLLSCQSESNLYSCLNFKELLARNKHDIWSLNESNEIRIHNLLVRKRTLTYLAELAKWLSCAVSTYLHGAHHFRSLSCHVLVSEWIYTLQLPKCQGSPCSKQVRYLKFNWQQQNSNPLTFRQL